MLFSGQDLLISEQLYIQNRRVVFNFQNDGNLVLREDRRINWETGPTKGRRLLMAKNGNLILLNRRGDKVLESFTKGIQNYFIVEDSGRINVRDRYGQILWTRPIF